MPSVAPAAQDPVRRDSKAKRHSRRISKLFGLNDKEVPETKSAFPFLALPREIRDEIYSYVLLFDNDPLLSFISMKTPNFNKFDGVTFPPASKGGKLSILQTNRQIHEEATDIFYRQNTFPMRIVFRGYQVSHHDGYTLYVSCSTPWEDLKYEFKKYPSVTGEEPYCSYQVSENFNEDPTQTWYVRRDEAETSIFPLPRYRNLLRKFRVEVIDARESADCWYQRRGLDELRHVLIPFVSRLRKLLGDTEEKINMDVNILSPCFGDRELWDWMHILREPASYYQQLVEMVWPLTRGAWACNISIPQTVGIEVFTGLQEKSLKSCTENPGFEPEEEEEMEYMEIPSVKSGLVFAMNKGRLVFAQECLRTTSTGSFMFPKGDYHIPGQPRPIVGDIVGITPSNDGIFSKLKIKRISQILNRF
ncbi:hypothetical protein H072_10783 [Dactylellina haptotyla CBS 200.50]|uniref:F-box domain-containing protein n=1 Tax=Dactylellina haptotyla (strain CBS 200.50) TaxID=1284197 RepID=S8A424_DACHA|nr:hypothetical protein H072_10783 [Dactylellina haptotyla CBS 200.50]